MDIKSLSKIDVSQIIKNKNLLANIGIIVLALVVIRNMHVGQVQKINLLKDQIKKENEITEFIDSLKAQEDKLDKLQKNFQVNLTTDRVIEKISVFAKENNIRINSIDAQTSLDKKNYQLLPITLRIESNYHKLGNLVSDIENTGFLKIRTLYVDNRQSYHSETPTESEIVLNLYAVYIKKK